MTSQSIEGRDFSDFEMPDAKMAFALKKIISNPHCRGRVSVEEQRAQKHDRFPRGRQIADMICDRFRATVAYDAAQDLSGLFEKRLQNDDVQDFDTRWNLALLAAIAIPKEMSRCECQILFSFRQY